MPQEKMNREEFMEWLREIDALVLFEENDLDEIEQKLDLVWWTAYNQGAVMERVRLESKLEIPSGRNGWSTTPKDSDADLPLEKRPRCEHDIEIPDCYKCYDNNGRLR